MATHNKGFAKKGLTEFYLADEKHGNNGINIGLLCCQSPFFAKPKTVCASPYRPLVMRTEENCKQSERFLQAVMLFSDKTIQACKTETKTRCKEKDTLYDKFINWERQHNEAAIFTMYAYADFSVPKKFDCIFSYDNPKVYIQTAFELTQSIWEGWYPIDNIENGHKHLCVLTFENKIPDIIKLLYYETKKYSTWTWDATKVLGLCQMANIQSIIDRKYK